MTDPYANRPGRQWRLVLVLLALSMLAAVDRQILALLVNPIKASLHLSDTQIGLVLGLAFAVANIAFTLPAGWAADRFSRRAMIATGVLVWSTMTMMCGAAGTYLQLFMARAGVGFGESVIGPGALSMLRSGLDEQRRGRGFAVHSMAGMAGAATALIVGGGLIGLVTANHVDTLPLVGAVEPWQVVLVLVGLLGLPFTALMLLVPEPARPAITDVARSQGYKVALGHVTSRWTIYLPLFVYQLVGVLISQSYGSWLAAMMGRTWGLSPQQIGGALGLAMLVLPAVGLWISGALLDRAAHRHKAVGPAALGMLTMLLYWTVAWATPLAPTLGVFAAFVAVMLLCSGICIPIAPMLTSMTAPSSMMGRVAALQLFLAGLIGNVLGPIIVAMVADGLFSGSRALANALSLVSSVYGAVGLVAAILVYRAIRKDRLHVEPAQTGLATEDARQ